MSTNPGQTLMGITWWFVGMATIAVALRFYVRARMVQQRCRSDDWFMLAATVLLFASQVLLTFVYEYGLGQTDDLSPQQLMDIFQFQWISVTPANLASVLSRISIAILLARIFSVKRWFRWFLIVITFLSTALGITVLVELWTSCRPVEALWDPELAANADCLDPRIFQNIGYAYQAVLTVTDFTFVLFPVMFVWKLNMSTRKKLGLIAVFSLGLFTVVTSIMKMLTVQSTTDQRGSLSATIPSLIWGTTEASMVVIMGCIPVLGPIGKTRISRAVSYLAHSLGGKHNSSTQGTSPANRSGPPAQAGPGSYPKQEFELIHSVDSREYADRLPAAADGR